MSFTLVTLSGVLELEPGNYVSGGKVQMQLQPPSGFSPPAVITDGVNEEGANPISAVTNSSGAFSLAVPANDDSTTSPQGTWYLVTISGPTGNIIDTFGVVVSHVPGTTQNLFSLPRLTVSGGKITAPTGQIITYENITKAMVEAVGGLCYQGNWAASTAYSVNDVVQNSGTTYICTVAHTSASTFTGDSSNWVAIGSGGGGGGGFSNPMSGYGDLIYGAASGTATRLPAGTAGQVLQTNGVGSAPTWITPAANPMTGVGDMLYGTTGGTPARLAPGTAGMLLATDGTSGAPYWTSAPATDQSDLPLAIGTPAAGTTAKFADQGHIHGTPLTTEGDLLVYGASGLTRIAIGASGTVLTSNGSGNVPTWQTVSGGGGGMSNPMTAEGDLIYGASSGTATRLAAGTAGQFLQTDGTAGAPVWAAALQPSNNLSDVASTGTSKYNLKVPTHVVKAVGVANTSISSAPATLDGYTMVSGDVVLLTGQSTASQNGLWTFNGSASAMTRPAIFPSGGTITDLAVLTKNGTVYAGSIWYITTVTTTVDTTGQAWALASLQPMTTAGDLVIGGTSGLPTRLGAGTSGYILTSNGAGTAPSWQAVPSGFTNPMSAEGDLIYGGSSGAATRLPAGTANQVLCTDGTAGAPFWTNAPTLTTPLYVSQSSDPSAPSSGNAYLYPKTIANKELFFRKSASGAIDHINNLPWHKQFWLGTATGTGAVGGVGGVGVNTSGTASAPGLASWGWMGNYATAATAGSYAYVGAALSSFRLGNSGDIAGGFFFAARCYFPDSSYDNTGASTGSRIGVGVVSSINLSTDNGTTFQGAMFVRRNVNGGATDSTWQFATNNGTSGNENLVNTTMTWTAQHVYDFFIWCPVGSSTIYWQINDLTAATSQTGTSTTSLPGATTGLFPMVALYTVDATTRNIRWRHIYCESDQG